MASVNRAGVAVDKIINLLQAGGKYPSIGTMTCYGTLEMTETSISSSWARSHQEGYDGETI